MIRVHGTLYFRHRYELGNYMFQESLSATLLAIQDKHKMDLTSQQQEHQLRMTELNTEMKRHRDRTIALLSEKVSAPWPLAATVRENDSGPYR